VGSHQACVPKKGLPPPRHEVADIFRAHGEAYRARHALTEAQRKAMWALMACRTAELGGHVDVCPECDYRRPAYNSCRNRHCPKCQALAQQQWLEKRKACILPVHYFHVVFTLPHELGPLGLRNQKLFYELLFRAASQTLLILGRDPKRLGALLGLTAVLHTWARNLLFHPHLHCIVTGGGLTADGSRWLATSRRYLFPVKVLGSLFRGKLLATLEQAHRVGLLDLPEDLATPEAFAELCGRLQQKSWVVYAKRPFAGPQQVFSYLGRYTHRVGLSNQRLLEVTEAAVSIVTRDGKTATMNPEEFIRRFLLHILPTGFVKIRHYGLMASSNVNTRLEVARRLLAPPPEPSHGPDEEEEPEDWRSMMIRLTGVDPTLCPACGARLVCLLVPPQPRRVPGPARSPP
jgi:hypothetical protein